MTQEKRPSERVRDIVSYKLHQISENPNESAISAGLARLRRGIGKKPGDIPELWAGLFADFPEELEGTGQEPSPAEWAVYHALTLYALHQQGKKPGRENMHEAGQRLGKAMAILSLREKFSEEAVQRRFQAMAAGADIQGVAWHLKGLVQLLRQQGIPLDYPALAEDLYRYQDLNQRSSVRLNWGRDYYRTRDMILAKESKGE